jgi:aryl-alcohol dehydrogenase-like predicted oxidoreductase
VRLLATTGNRVSELALGTMDLGAWGNPDHDECERIVHRALDAGINLVDTADVYAFGESEEIVGRALKGRRDEVVLATKFQNAMSDDPNHRGNSRRWITRAVEDSLRRLQTDRIDLYQVHRPDPDTDLDETMGALSDLVHAGKVLAVGSSTFPPEDLVDAWWRAEVRGHVRMRTEQAPYSILARHVEAHVLPTCERLGLGVLAWAPLQGGWLTGKYRRGQPVPQGSRADTNPEHFDAGHERKLDLVESLLALAGEAGVPLAHLVLAFVLAHPAVTSAIIGPRTMAHLEDVLPSAGVRLSEDVLDRIDELCPPGTMVDRIDVTSTVQSLTDPAQRRRSAPPVPVAPPQLPSRR